MYIYNMKPTQTKPQATKPIFADLNRSAFEHKNKSDYIKRFRKGLTRELVEYISADKNEPKWMLAHRLRAFDYFNALPLPTWGPDLSSLDLDEICYFAKAADKKGGFKSWEEVPSDIKNTFERLGIPEAERAVLAGVGAQYESEAIYHSLEKELSDLGVIFTDLDIAVHEYPDLVKKYFMKCVVPNAHKFAALHGAVWSGGTFLYIPKGVKVEKPLQSYFRMNAMNMGQFEHTLIIIEDGAEGHYIEGCSAPKYGTQALHAGCVEVFVGKGAKFRYSSVENWSKDTYNLNSKRAIVEEDASMEWVGGNMGSGVTVLYPCSVLKGDRSAACHLGIAFANEGIVMKSLSKGGGVSSYRGLIHVAESADNAISQTECDALILDPISVSDTTPDIKVDNPTATVNHEARVGKLNEEDIFYLTSRGIPQEEAEAMIVNGFINPIVRELPLEYAVEMNRLIELEMEEAVG
jgi:Fe-S cluster assembly protein SufB